VFGMTSSTVLTLFVIPVVYVFLSERLARLKHRQPQGRPDAVWSAARSA
jgi:hypothetical protein